MKSRNSINKVLTILLKSLRVRFLFEFFDREGREGKGREGNIFNLIYLVQFLEGGGKGSGENPSLTHLLLPPKLESFFWRGRCEINFIITLTNQYSNLCYNLKLFLLKF